MSEQPPPAPTASRRPLPYSFQISRTPRHWKFAQHHRTTRPPPPPRSVDGGMLHGGLLVGKLIIHQPRLTTARVFFLFLSVSQFDYFFSMWINGRYTKYVNSSTFKFLFVLIYAPVLNHLFDSFSVTLKVP